MDQIVQFVSDVLLGAGALGAAVYCIVLARRLKRFNNLENGVGGAVAVLSAQVDDMTRTLEGARKSAAHSAESLTALTERAEASARKLELMMAALHDLPDEPSDRDRAAPPTRAAAHDPPDLADEARQNAAWAMAGSDESDLAPRFASRRHAEPGRGA